jgi:FlaA1/EpsC-like NDP-sugar epimerase
VIGLRPGERLREELVQAQEELLPTGHEKVFMVRNHQFDSESFKQELEELRRVVSVRDGEGAVARLRAMVARY